MHNYWVQRERGDGQTDSTGLFFMCVALPKIPVTIRATRDSLVSADVVTTIDSLTRTTQVELTLLPPSSATLPRFRRRRFIATDDASRAPLPGVEVLDALTDRVLGRTSSDGTMSLASLPDGRSVLRVRKVGYEQRTVIADVGPADTLPVALSLRTVAQLEAVTVTAAAIGSRLAASSGFDDRAKQGYGRFLRRSDFERHSGETLADLLQTIGVKQVEMGATSSSFGIRPTVLMGGHGTAACPVTIYIDGALVYSKIMAGATPPNAASMYGIDYAAAEYYTGAELPPEYAGGDGGFGLLLLWRKD
jgi:hypothetical protein